MKHISRAQAPELLSTPELSSKALSPCIVVFALCMLGMIFCAQEGLSTTLQKPGRPTLSLSKYANLQHIQR